MICSGLHRSLNSALWDELKYCTSGLQGKTRQAQWKAFLQNVKSVTAATLDKAILMPCCYFFYFFYSMFKMFSVWMPTYFFFRASRAILHHYWSLSKVLKKLRIMVTKPRNKRIITLHKHKLSRGKGCYGQNESNICVNKMLIFSLKSVQVQWLNLHGISKSDSSLLSYF